MGPLLSPLQLGYGTPLGAEAATHSARIYLKDLPNNHVLIRLDFKNAFNSVRRGKVLKAVKEVVPELFPFLFSCYSAPSTLFLGDTTLLSAEGIQQGDPLGPLLFCLVIHPLVQQLQSELRIFFLDDGTIGGPEAKVLQDFQLVEQEAALMGLHLNHHKTELICRETDGELILHAAPDVNKIAPKDAFLLGSPIGGLPSIDAALLKKVEGLKTMGDTVPFCNAGCPPFASTLLCHPEDFVHFEDCALLFLNRFRDLRSGAPFYS